MSRKVQKQQHKQPTRRARLEELEPRILYSADFIPALLDDTVAAPEQRVIDTGGEFAQQAATEQKAEACRHELVLVESDTPDYQKLVDDIVKQDDPSRDIKVVVLDRNRDGVAQITSILSQYQDLSAVHLIAHGSDGQVQLGTTTLNFDTLLKSAAQIKGWGKAFGAGGDLLLYGCGVAQHADGKALVDALAALTGADVAASDDPTGQRDLGGDWELEYQDGTVETHLAITIRAQLDWRHALAVPVAANDTYSVNEDSTLTVAPAATTSLVDWYELDDSGNSQTTKDSVPPADNGRRGSTGGGDATDPTWTAGRVGSGALSFDGIDDYVTTPSTVLKTANNFTISAWFQTTTTTGQHPILWQGYSGGSGYGDPGLNNPSSSELSLSVGTYDQDNKITFFLGYDVPGSGNGADPIYIVSARNFTDTVGWHHVGVTVSDLGGGVLSGCLYVDGVLEGTDTGIQNDRSQWGDLRMGDTGANSRLLDGKIDDVRLHDTALSAAQVQGLARAGVLQNDTDTNQKGLSAVLVAGPANGTLSLNADGSFSYTPNANFAGTDTFTYQANDGTSSSNIATATIMVNPVNDPPVLGANALTLNQGGSVLLSAANLSASDVDNAAGSLSFSISNISSGRFEYVSAPGAAITSFTQADVAGGLVRFVHDGSGTAPAYDVSVSDGSLGVGPIAASIAFSPAPLPAPAPPPPPPMLNNASPVKAPAPSPAEPAPVQPASTKPLTAVVPPRAGAQFRPSRHRCSRLARSR